MTRIREATLEDLKGRSILGKSALEPPTVVDALLVRYFAVYPDGRRCRVSMQDALDFGEQWKNVDDVRVVTKLERQPHPVVGTLEQG